MANVVSCFPYAMEVQGGTNPYSVVIGSSEYDTIDEVDILCDANAANHNAEFQLALDTAKEGVVYIRPGNYKLDGTQTNKVKGNFTYGMRLIGDSTNTVIITCTSRPPLWENTDTDDGACIFSPSGPVTISNITFKPSSSFSRNGVMVLISDSQFKEEIHIIQDCVFDTSQRGPLGSASYNALLKIGARIKNIWIKNNIFIGLDTNSTGTQYYSPIWIGQPSVTDKGKLGYVPRNVFLMGNKFFGYWGSPLYIFRVYGLIMINNTISANSWYNDEPLPNPPTDMWWGLSIVIGQGNSTNTTWPGSSGSGLSNELLQANSSPMGLIMIDSNSYKTKSLNSIAISPYDNGGTNWEEDNHGSIITKNYFEIGASYGNSVGTTASDDCPISAGQSNGAIFANNHVKQFGPNPTGSGSSLMFINSRFPTIVTGNVMDRDVASTKTQANSFLCGAGASTGITFQGIVSNNMSYTDNVRNPSTTTRRDNNVIGSSF